MATSRIDPKDAAFYYETRPGATTDHYLTTALEHGSTTVTADALESDIGRRAGTIAALRVRLSVPSFDLDYPTWVPRTAPLPHDVVVHPVPGGTWTDARNVLGSILAQPLDARRTSWRVHILHDVSGVPSADGPASIVIVQLAHCLTDGAGAVAVTRTLLGDDSVAAALPSPSIDRERSPHLGAARGLARLPGQIVGLAAASARSLRSSRDFQREVDAGSVASRPARRTPTVFNDDPGSDRVAHVVVLPAASLTSPGGGRVSVTTATLTAIARAMAAFLRQQGHAVPDDLGAHVTVALPDGARWSGVNRLASANVDLFPDAIDRLTQSTSIAHSLARERVRATHQAVLDSVRVADHLPATVLRQGIRRMARSAGDVDAHTTVSSVRCGPNDLGIAGTRSLFMTAFASLSTTNGLNHTVFGLGDTIAIGIVTSPRCVPAHDRYVESLSAELS